MQSTPVSSLHASVQSLLLTCASLGGLVGTIGSNMLYDWNGKPAIDITGLCCGLFMLVCVCGLWLHESKISKKMKASKISGDLRKVRYGRFYKDPFRADIQRARHYRMGKPPPTDVKLDVTAAASLTEGK